jgi:hypothetical protein
MNGEMLVACFKALFCIRLEEAKENHRITDNFDDIRADYLASNSSQRYSYIFHLCVKVHISNRVFSSRIAPFIVSPTSPFLCSIL